MRRPIIELMLAGAAVFSIFLLSGASTDKGSDFVIRSEVPLVLLDVSVQDRAGGFVSGLTRDSFHVLENGHPVDISVFSAEDVPVTAGIVIDESYSMTPKRADAVAAALTLIRESNPKDEMFVLNFNDSVRLGLPKDLPFSDNIEQLRAALDRGVPVGKTALYDAVLRGLKHLRLGRRDKKTLVVITDGGDNASKGSRQEMLAAVESSLATIYTIGLYDVEDPSRDIRILKRLAAISGGEAYFPQNATGMVPVCRRIAKDIRARYTIGYPPPPGKGKDDWRHIRVRVSAPGRGKLVARTRSGYRYSAAAETKAGAAK